MNLEELVEPGLRGESISQEQALQVLAVPDSEVMALVAAAGRVRRRFFGVTVKLNYLVNLKSGMCPENCSYCSQAMGSDAPILRYSWLRPDEVDAQVQAGVQAGASTVCLVASGRGPSKREVAQVAEIVEGIHRNHPDLTVCACLGFVDDAKARQLAESGVTRYNHNLNTAESAYPQICTTHTYADRVRTVQAATAGGLSACCGLIAGMGESPEELVAVTLLVEDPERGQQDLLSGQRHEGMLSTPVIEQSILISELCSVRVVDSPPCPTQLSRRAGKGPPAYPITRGSR